tara:strand:- start:7627 stop:12795 length:5169 start_codon:yes stop_codon:yes gene_type:complete
MAINTRYNTTKGAPESLIAFNRIQDKDIPLIQRLELDTSFNPSKNRLDVFFYSLDGRYLSSIVDSKSYSVVRGGSTGGVIEDITLNPEKDSISGGYPNGDVNVLYNFVNNLFSSNNTQPRFFIESISPDRTEIRALSNEISNKGIVRNVDLIKERISSNSYFEDFRLNFSNNKLPIAINIDRIDFEGNQAVLIKLYQPLAPDFGEKDVFQIEELVGDSVLYEVITDLIDEQVDTQLKLRGPNFDIELVEENNNPTGFLNYTELFNYPVSNSFYEVYSLFNEKGSQISIDHTDYNNFIQFSSAEERLNNFRYKVSLLESYKNDKDSRTKYTGSIEENIKNIVNNFDHYDRYLYFETGSKAWPKSSSTRPFELYSTGSSEVATWFTSSLVSASAFDTSNPDRLTNSIPSFLRDDPNNAPYSLFVDMIGQHFDNLWIYTKSVTDKYDADNRLDFGISKDLVRDAIEGYGISLYNNNEALENLFSAFTGEAHNTGSEVISSLIVAVEGSGSLTGSAGNEHLQPMPKTSYQKEVYKRLYHNLPLLLKSKGTERGLRALINSLGIPSDVLSIKTFGGGEVTSSIFYGPENEFTSSLDKIRIANSDTVTTGSTLSQFSSVVKPGADYSTDLHSIEVGFSPSDSLNKFIKSHPSMSSFNIDEYIGDPGLIYSSSYSSLDNLAETVFTSGSSYANVYNAFDFVRLIKFFDNSLFRIVKDFVPARSNVNTGVIVKPHILDRSKIKQPEVKWSNQTSPSFDHSGTQLDFTGSFYTSNFSLEGNISTAFMTGSSGLDSGYTSSYTETYANPSGGFQTLTRNNHDEPSFTGEFSGSIIKVSNGDLTTGNTFRKLEPENFSFKYIPRNDFTSGASVITATGDIVTIVGTSGSIQSPSPQDGTGTAIEVSVENIDDYTADFRISGGPNNIGGYLGGAPIADSASVRFLPDEDLADGESLIIDVTVEYGTSLYIDGYSGNSDLGKVTLELVTGSLSSFSTVASVELKRDTTTSLPTSETKVETLSFNNNSGGTLETPAGGPGSNKYFWFIKYSSNYNTVASQNFLDAQVTYAPRKLVFNNDAITLWLSEDTTSNYTASLVQAMTVPLRSSTNGSMIEYLREASEVVFQYPNYVPVNYFDKDIFTSSVEGGAYRASSEILDDQINLFHITSAPYSASFNKALPSLPANQNLEFNFTVDFQSYWSNYLNTFNSVNTPFVTASIRNKNTKVVTGSLSFDVQQGQYPNEHVRSLKFENNTGATLNDLEFYYQVNVPKADKGQGAPIVNLKNISVNYREPSVVFNRSKVLSSQKLLDTFYLDIAPDVEVFSGSLTYFVPSTDYFKVGFITGESELFKFNDYAPISSNVDAIRRSSLRLKVEDKTYSSTRGKFQNFLVPSNFEIISSSIVNGVEGLDKKLFAEIQDSNYSLVSWKNGRYDGSLTNNRRRGVRVLGLEPSLTFDKFNSFSFPLSASNDEIRGFYSTFEDSGGSEKGDTLVYYNKYESKLLGDVLLEFESAGGNASGTATLNTSTVNSLGVTVDGVSQGLYNWSGSIGEFKDGGSVEVDFNVIYSFWTADEISGSEASSSPGTRTPGEFTITLVDEENGGLVLDSINTTYSDATFVQKPNGYSDEYRYTYLLRSDVVSRNVAIKFQDSNLYEEAGGSTSVTLNFNSFKKSNFIPVNNPTSGIVAETPELKTFFYKEVLPTPSNPNGYDALTQRKFYRLDTGQIYSTNDLGIVTNIE